MVGRKGLYLRLEVEMYSEIMEIVNSFELTGKFYTENGGMQEDVEML